MNRLIVITCAMALGVVSCSPMAMSQDAKPAADAKPATDAKPAVEAKRPPQPTKAEAERLISEGDRLVDQQDYVGALERYTEAYHAVVSRIRGQKFDRQVMPTLLTRKELGEEVIRMMEKEYTPEEFALMDATYTVLGMMPSSVQSKKLLTTLLSEQIAGFYDPEKERMVLIREENDGKEPGFFERLLGAKASFDKDEQKTTLAHEMTHALQDQLYNLDGMQKRIEKDDDMLLAFSSLVEGDATLLMFVEMDDGSDVRQMDPAVVRTTFTLMSFMLPVAGGASYRQAPAIFRESLTFPYFQGMLFCVALAAKDGWQSVHKAYQSPPTSTEQIMHPDKYTEAERDEPQTVIMPDLTDIIGSPWKHLGGNCLGEFQASVMLKRVRNGARAAAGWDGDRYEIYSGPDGRLGVVLVSVWDSEKDAQEFAAAYRLYREPADRGGMMPESDDEPEKPAADKPQSKSPRRSERRAKARQAADGQPKTDASDSKSDDQQPAKPAKDEDIAADSKEATVLGSPRIIEQHGDQVWIIEGFDNPHAQQIRGRLEKCRFEPKVFPQAN